MKNNKLYSFKHYFILTINIQFIILYLQALTYENKKKNVYAFGFGS